MIGYHHVLMIIIAVAIILLCKFSSCHMVVRGMSLTCPSLTTGRMFVIITANTGYLFDLSIL